MALTEMLEEITNAKDKKCLLLQFLLISKKPLTH